MRCGFARAGWGQKGVCVMAADEMPGGETGTGVSAEEMQLLLQQAQREELQADDARLSSVESFNMWVMSHPALRQMQIVDSLHQIGPAILEVLKKLLGL